MSTFRLIYKEIIHRKLNFLLSLLAIVTAVALFVSFFTAGEASKNETTRLMRDIGFNVRIVSRQTDMGQFLADGFAQATMPEEYVQRFATQENIAFNHLLATLQRKIVWGGQQIILTGTASQEIIQPGEGKLPMKTAYSIKPGTALIGAEVATGRGGDAAPADKAINVGDQIDILGHDFTVTKRLPPTGTDDDIRVFVNLGDAQNVLDLKGQVNEIKALECLCLDPNKTTAQMLEETIDKLLPEARVVRIESLAQAREKQRLMAERYFAFIIPVIIVVCALWIGALAMINVRDRRQEIGILRALGHGSGRIALLFLGKAALVGVVGAVIGYLIGTELALKFGPGIFRDTAAKIAPIHALLLYSLIAAPAFAALSSFIPAMTAVTQDPASTLREE